MNTKEIREMSEAEIEKSLRDIVILLNPHAQADRAS